MIRPKAFCKESQMAWTVLPPAVDSADFPAVEEGSTGLSSEA